MRVGIAAWSSSRLVVMMGGLLVLSGCSGGSIGGLDRTGVPAAATKMPGMKLTGSVHGGQFPISSANVYVFQASTAGYGSPSLSLLSSAPDTIQDASGGATQGDYYVMTDGNGRFSITLGDYTCTQNTQVYLYTLGGDPGLGSGQNSSASLMAVLGNCPVAGNFAGSSVAINEVSTVAAAYAMAGFATDALHVSSSATPLAQVGIANAFANAANLVSMGSGLARTATPAGNGTVPRAEINTLANILAACINSDGAVTDVSSNPTACYTLFTSALSGGTTGTQPTDTATAAIYIAHHPGASVASLFDLLPTNPPFLPELVEAPNHFTVALTFTAGGLNLPSLIAIDGAGNAWIASSDASAAAIVELSSAGAVLSGTGYPVGVGSQAVAIDLSGNAWVTSSTSNNVTELSNAGSILSGPGYTSLNMSSPDGIAIDGSGNVWVANVNSSISELSSGGAILSGNSGYTSSDLNAPGGVAIDATGNAWIANGNGVSVTEFSNAGALQSGFDGFTSAGIYDPVSIAIDGSGSAWVAGPYGDSSLSPGSLTRLSSLGVASCFTGGGLQNPRALAVDGAGNVWVGDSTSNIVEFSNSGSLLSGATGYLTPTVSSTESGVAIDGSGNVWIVFTQSNAVGELIGAGVPVVTPLSVGVQNNTLGMQP